MNLLDSRESADKLIELMDQHRQIAFAVAWASHKNKVFEKLQEVQHKIKYGVVGTHFSQTRWEVLDWSMNNEAKIGFIFEDIRNSVFHPKVYLFWSGQNDWDALIGSANLTVGGMSNNTELMMHVSSKSGGKNELRLQILKTIREYWNESVYVTSDRLNKYKKSWQERQKSLQRERSKSTENQEANWDDNILSWSWRKFYGNVRQADKSERSKRLKLLNECRKVLDSEVAFHELDIDTRKGIAGSYRREQHIPEGTRFNGFMVGGFGFTSSSGDFTNLINTDNGRLREFSKAIACIPSAGTVSRDDYLDYIAGYEKAMEGKSRGLGTAARLLTVKRPDTFVPFNGFTRSFLRASMNLRPEINPKDYQRYWDEIIDPISKSDWFSSPEPRGQHAREIWQNRVAFLDVLPSILGYVEKSRYAI